MNIIYTKTALDPLFWVAHGSMERVFQKLIFTGEFSDMEYSATSHCSGHDSGSSKSWLEGFYFLDETVVAENVGNGNLTAILDPRSDLYRDLVSFVYDMESFSWCENSASWFI